MKTLIIHPDDRSTDFLRDIYRHLDDTTLVTKNISRGTLHELIRSHDQIVMLGHGSPNGLFNVAKIGEGAYTIGEMEVPLLRDKKCIFVWCNANLFTNWYQLKGIYTGMFISETGEAQYCGVKGNQEQVDQSNKIFSLLLGNALNINTLDYKGIHNSVGESYEELAEINPIAKYNSERWYIN